MGPLQFGGVLLLLQSFPAQVGLFGVEGPWKLFESVLWDAEKSQLSPSLRLLWLALESPVEEASSLTWLGPATALSPAVRAARM